MLDYNFGIQNEKLLLPVLREKFGETLRPTNRYCLYDFYNNSCIVELKSRRCKSTTYSTTMIGENKLEMARKQFDLGKEIYFCFNYTDGLFYYKYDPDYNYTFEKGGRCDRGRPEIKNYAYIPIDLLIKV
jgi:hypothetical protein